MLRSAKNGATWRTRPLVIALGYPNVLSTAALTKTDHVFIVAVIIHNLA